MAKFGEGDARWIVKDLDAKEGTNVHGWHWQEKDALEWSRKRLGDLLGGVQIADGQGGLWIKTTTLQSCTGEAYVNKRKGKIIPGYEVEVKLGWEGEAREGGQAAGAPIARASGVVHFPYLADENADEDPEIKVSTAGSTTADDRMRQACLTLGAPVLRERVRVWVKELAAGGPGGDAPAEGAPAAASPAEAAAAAKAAALKKAADERAAAAKAAAAEERGTTRTIRVTEKFYARPADIFDALTHPGRVRAFTQSECDVSAEPGKAWWMFGGNIHGENVEMDPATGRIVQKWRFKNWPEGVFSTVTITMREPEAGNTIVEMVQTGVPVADAFGNESVVDTTTVGWRENIFSRIRRVFGFGA